MTTIKKHLKHPPLTRPTIGHYHKCEWSIYGSTCNRIKELFFKLNSTLSSSYTLAYVDADHGTPSMFTNYQIGKKHFFIDNRIEWNEYDDKSAIPPCDAVIVNGNHFPANRQIVIIDSSKKESLLRRIEQLTAIEMIVLLTPDEEIYEFLQDKITSEIPVCLIDDVQKIKNHIQNKISESSSSLKALILAGGKSKRMGNDKSLITYHNKPQQVYMAEMCQSLDLETFISKGSACKENTIEGFKVINDRLVDMGPFGAIVSAMMYDPDAAWLVVACDLPYVDKEFLQVLLENRAPSATATAIKSINKDFPEPLITIYEPSAYTRFLKFMALGYSCPRKVLINSNVNIIEWEDDRTIDNINTPEERNAVLTSLKIQ